MCVFVWRASLVVWKACSVDKRDHYTQRYMRYSTLIGIILLSVPWFFALGQEQTVQIAQGSSVVLRANATFALAYLWFHDGEPINGHHDEQLTVVEGGTYTVMALGYDCDSDLSEPVHVIVDDNLPGVQVDMRIRNEPSRPSALLGEAITYQLLVHNDGEHTATGVTTTVRLPPEVEYKEISGHYKGNMRYNPATRHLVWEYGTMAPGEVASLSIVVMAARKGLAAQWSTVTSVEEDINVTNNEAVATVEIIALTVPNVFTPNGDGVNDRFVIPNIERFPQHRLIIFNRWGNEIYASTGYENDWDGGLLAEGTYYYVLEIKLESGQWQTLKGFVTLIRTAPGG